MRHALLLVVASVVTLSCASSDVVRQDIGEATLTESKSDVAHCEYVGKVSASVELSEFDNDRDAAMESLLDRLLNSTLHRRCDTVYLVRVDETTTRFTAHGEGYRCRLGGVGGKPVGATDP